VKILFDQGTPVPLKKYLSGHDVATVFERGWNTLKNGELLAQAEREQFDVFITTDSHLKDQQNLAGRTLAIIVVCSASWPRIEPHASEIVAAVNAVKPGALVEIIV
jgi:hypothetical protein